MMHDDLKEGAPRAEASKKESKKKEDEHVQRKYRGSCQADLAVPSSFRPRLVT